MKKFKIGLAYQIIIALVLGCVVGAVFYGNSAIATYLQPVADVFVRLIKMIVVPIVLCSLIVGIAGSDDSSKHVGRLGFKTIVYFEIMSLIAIVVGVITGTILHPGTGINISSLVQSSIKNIETNAHAIQESGFISTFVNIVPTNIFDSLAKSQLLAIIFFAVMFAMGLNHLGEKKKVVISLCDGISHAMFWVTNQVMKVAPYGVFATMAVTVSKFGIKSLIPLGKLVIITYGLLFIFGIGLHALMAKMFKLNLFQIMKAIKEELILAYSTASSEAVLPKVMEKAEKLGAPKGVATFVIPLGYTFNLFGGMLYEGMAVLFIAQMYNIHLSTFDLFKLVMILMVTTKGVAGVAGGAFVVIMATLTPMGLPAEGMAFIIGIDRILDMGRTAINVLGNVLASLIMSKLEGVYDEEKGKEYLKSLNNSESVA